MTEEPNKTIRHLIIEHHFISELFAFAFSSCYFLPSPFLLFFVVRVKVFADFRGTVRAFFPFLRKKNFLSKNEIFRRDASLPKAQTSEPSPARISPVSTRSSGSRFLLYLPRKR